MQWIDRKQLFFGPKVVSNDGGPLDTHDSGVVKFEIQLSALLSRAVLPIVGRLDVRDGSVEVESGTAKKFFIDNSPALGGSKFDGPVSQ